MKKLSLVLTLVLFALGSVLAQRTITGTVTDQNGEALIGASILVKGTSSGTVTDVDGSYSLSVPDGEQTLIFSYTGFGSKEVTTGASTVINVTLLEGVTLSEAVVTALGIERSEKSVPYAVQQVNEEQLNPIRQTNLNNALAGKVAGIQVRGQSSVALGRNPAIRIRGTGSLTDKQPLYVIDGTPVSSSVDINMDDVESVSVLKGPNATALYGQRGDAGVIVISTKKGAQTKGVGIEVNQSTFFDRVYILPEYQNSYAGGGSADLIQYNWQAGQPEEWKVLDGKYYHDYTDDASWGPKMEGQEYIPWYAWYVGTPDFGKTAPLVGQPDNIRDFYNTGVTANTNVNFSKATQDYRLRVSYTNQNINGMLPNSKQGKNTISTIGSFDLGKYFTVGVNINYITTRTDGEFTDGYANQSSGSFNQWFHRNLDLQKMRDLKDMKSPEGVLGSWNHNNPGDYANGAQAFYGGNYWYNFYSYFDNIQNIDNRQRLFGNLNLTFKLNDKFSIAGFMRRDQETRNFENKTYYILEYSATQTGVNNAYGTGEYFDNETNYEVLAIYADRFGAFSVEANAGGNLREDRYKRIYANTNGTGSLNVPDLFTLNNGAIQPFQIDEFRSKKDVRSLYARGSFGFKETVYLDWSARNDWSSALPKDNNSYFYPSVGFSFVFSELTGGSLPWLSYGKLRGSWAQVGSDLGAYQLALTYGIGNQWDGNFTTGTPNQLVDPNIKPSLSSAYEGGVDLRFFRNRIGLSVTYFDETKTDEILSVPIGSTSGFTSKVINAGKVTRNGIELQLDVNPVQTSNFDWNFTFNFAKVNNEIVELAPGTDAYQLGGAVWGTRHGTQIWNVVGEPWGQLRGGGIKKLNGQPVVDASGRFIQEPNVYFGSALPDFTGGFFNTLTFLKDFTFQFHIDFSKGGKYSSSSAGWLAYSGLSAETAAVNENGKNVRDPVADGGGVHVVGVTADGQPVDRYVDAFTYYHQFFSRRIAEPFVFDLTYVKLRELSLGYNVPVRKLGWDKVIQRAQISLVARNPWLIYAKNRDFDPSEISSIYGEDGQFPGTRSVGFNIKLGF